MERNKQKIAEIENQYQLSKNLADLEKIAIRVSQMPDGEEKDLAFEVLRGMRNTALENRMLGSTPIAPDKWGMDILDYGPGVLRAGVGEALASVGEKDFNPARARENIESALLPFGKPAPSVTDYRERLGYGGPGTSLTQAVPALSKYITAGGPLDITQGGAFDFAASALLDPAVLTGLKGLASGGYKKLSERGATAAQLRDKYAKELESAKNTSTLTKVAKGTFNAAMNPVESLGMMSLRSRFKNADKAAAAVNKRLPSDILLEGGKLPITTEGIAGRFGDILQESQKNVSDVVEQVGAKATPIPRENIMAPLYDKRMQTVQGTVGRTKAATEAVADMEDEFRAAALSNPEQFARYEATVAANKLKSQFAKEGAQKQMANLIEVPNPKAGQSRKAYFHNGREVPPNHYSVKQGWAVETEIPEPDTITTVSVGPASNYPPKTVAFQGNPDVSDILDMNENFSVADLDRLKKAQYQDAAELGKFGRVGYMGVKNKTDIKALGDAAVLADLKYRVASNAGEKMETALDAAQKGAGGRVFKENQKMAGIMEGAPYLDKTYFGPGMQSGTRSTNWLASIRAGGGRIGTALDAFAEGANVGKMGVAKLALSPWGRYVVSPALRYQVAEELNQRQKERPNRNPWTSIDEIILEEELRKK